MPPPPLIRLGSSCCNLVKFSSFLGCKVSVRSLAYTTCSDVSVDSSSDTSHPLENVGKLKAINETLNQLKREWSSASLFIRQLKESGFKHDLETYMSLVRLLCHWDWGMDASSDKLLNDVIDNTNWDVASFQISEHLFDALMEEKLIKAVEGLVEVYARAGKLEEAIHALSEMKIRSGVMVSTETCNVVLNQLIIHDKVDMVESVYEQLKRNGLISDAQTYRILAYTYGIRISVLCEKGCLKEAWDVFEEMEEAGVEPDAFTYSAYIRGLCCKGKTDSAFQLLKNLRESNKPVHVMSYACVIQGFVDESKLQDAEDVLLHDMKNTQVVPNAHCYKALIRGYCEKGDMAKALDLFKEMETSDHMFVRWIMQYMSDLDMLDEALYVFKHFTQQSKGIFLDVVSFNIAIDAACKLGKVDDAMGLVEEMKHRKIKPLVMQALGSEPTTGVQSEGVHDGVVQDARDQAAVGNVGQLHLHTGITDQTRSLLSSLNAHHAVILKKLRKPGW